MQDEKPDRAPYRLNKQEFENILNLHTRQPWTVGKQPQLYALLEECKNIDEQSLILDLLSAYENFDETRSAQAFNAIYQQINAVWSLNPANTLIIALHNENEVGSGPAFLQAIKPFFPGTEWRRKLVANLTPALTQLNSGMDIVLVDDFVGTGGQFCGAFDWFMQQLNSRGITPNAVYLTSLCIMTQAIPLIEERNVIHFSSLYMEKGITGRLDAHRADSARRLMVEIEQRLKWKNEKQREKYSLGFSQSEALFRYMDNNAPNNNFPIFWWKETSDGYPRDTMQMRF